MNDDKYWVTWWEEYQEAYYGYSGRWPDHYLLARRGYEAGANAKLLGLEMSRLYHPLTIQYQEYDE